MCGEETEHGGWRWGRVSECEALKTAWKACIKGTQRRAQHDRITTTALYGILYVCGGVFVFVCKLRWHVNMTFAVVMSHTVHVANSDANVGNNLVFNALHRVRCAADQWKVPPQCSWWSEKTRMCDWTNVALFGWKSKTRQKSERTRRMRVIIYNERTRRTDRAV